MCGVFGIAGHPEAANLTYLGLHSLQHRGQESCGIATSDGAQLRLHRAMGRVAAAFSASELETLPGAYAIGHVRYSTAGSSNVRNAQPIAVDYARGSIAVAHNGNLTNHEALREQLEARGSIFQSGSDTETVVHLIAMSTQRAVEDRIADALRQVEGAFSMIFLADDKVVAVRDPRGIRPLALGKLKRRTSTDTERGDSVAPTAGERDAYVVASEPTSFDLIGAEQVRDIEPGEMVVLGADGSLLSRRPFETRPRRACLFEWVYFARPDAQLAGTSVYEVRKAMGRMLAQEHPLEDVGNAIVTPVPDSGVPAAIGFAEASGIPFEMGLIRSHYIGRTFIEPQDSIRHFGVRLKLNPNRGAIEGRRVVVVDDSIVRGTTSRKIVKMLRDAGAKEIHVRISSPPTTSPCYYGIDTPTREELIASRQSVEEIRAYLGADSLGYLSLGGLAQSVRDAEALALEKAPALSAGEQPAPASGLAETGERAPVSAEGDPGESYCHACFSGHYPVAIEQPTTSRKLRLVDG